jgi:nucleotide-binding universal stress UspA family protein
MKILLAADGSACTEAAARHLIAHLDWFANNPELHVLHVSTPMPPRVVTDITTVAGRSALGDYHLAESEAALLVATQVFKEAGVPCQCSWIVGDVATELDRYVRRHQVDLVVMGSHGHGALAGMVLGSVTTQCLATLEAPILVVRRPSDKSAPSLEKAA